MIGRAIRHLRKRRGWSQQMLATRLGVRVERVRAFETAATPMRPRMLIRLARVLDVPLSALFRNYRQRRRPLGISAAAAAAYSHHRPVGSGHASCR